MSNAPKGKNRKNYHLSVPISQNVVEQLTKIAERYEITRAEVVRRMITKGMEEMQ